MVLLATACVQLRVYAERTLKQNKPSAFTLIELLLYVVLLTLAIPLIIATVRMTADLQQHIQHAVVVQVYHRAAYARMVRDVALCESWSCEHENEVVFIGTTLRGTWTPEPWQVTYQLRDDGLFRQRVRETAARSKKSSVCMAPRPEGFALEAGQDGVKLLYQATSAIQWHCIVPRVAGVVA